jgi:hypothetical protein
VCAAQICIGFQKAGLVMQAWNTLSCWVMSSLEKQKMVSGWQLTQPSHAVVVNFVNMDTQFMFIPDFCWAWQACWCIARMDGVE